MAPMNDVTGGDAGADRVERTREALLEFFRRSGAGKGPRKKRYKARKGGGP